MEQSAQGTRTALLIGVGNTPAAEHRFASLEDAVTADLRTLGAALRGAGYEVDILRDPPRNEITDRIVGMARKALPGSTLLLYFTGHGVRIGDTDYLVPADARAPVEDEPGAWEQPHIQESLLDADISRYLSGCGAGTVLWLIDACRSPEDGGPTVFGSSITKGPPDGGFAVLTGCRPGQRSGYTANGSFFSLALAEAFDPLTEAGTVDQVYETARRRARELSLRHRAERQDAQIHYGRDLAERTAATVVAPGRRLLDAWREVVREPALWERVAAADAESVPRCQEQLTALAEQTGRLVHHAQRRLPDPWADDGFPVRVLRDRLPQLLAEDAELSALEVTALIAGVFLHEAAWADRLSQAHDVMPHFVHHVSDGDELRQQYEQVLKQHAQIADKLSGRYWWRETPSDEGQMVALWLVHRWIADRFVTDDEAVPVDGVAGFAARLVGADPSAPADRLTGRAGELATALCLVAAGPALGAAPEGQTRGLPERYALPGGTQRLRVRPLAALLRLAGLLALDARTLPDVLAEHLAVSDAVLPREVVGVLREAVWDVEEAGTAPRYLHLDSICPHPAIHAALSAVAAEADELAHSLRELAGRLAAPEAELLMGLPARITDQRLRPAEARGQRAYDVPLLRFSLAQTEVRRLLMGEKLYDGEPQLAVRELYQNAMDACRYRGMRVRYLAGLDRQPAPWTGVIRIQLGEDARGRYVECVDNGVGMTVDQLTNTFTQAGRRFEQSREFRREQATWLRHDSSLKLYPNSRFGIGVFSYFMLADEMTIVTRSVGPDGRPAARALRVEIPGSGSLFRIQQDDEQGGEQLPEGGTRVRLYLRHSYTLSAASCESVLRALVLVSEFRLEVGGAAGADRVWEAGALLPGFDARSVAADTAVEAVPGRLWWVKGNGAILCDGIATDKRPFGYVLNLTGPHAGELSVNRKKLERYDTAWAAELWRRGADALATWPELELGWLRALEAQDLGAARTIWGQWRGQGIRVRNGHRGTVSLDEVGWFSLDRHLGDKGHSDNRVVREAVRPWRSTMVGNRSAVEQHAGPLSTLGHPVPEPGWADVAARADRDWRTVVVTAQRQGTTVAEILRAVRGLRIAHPRLAGPGVRAGDLGWEPNHLDAAIMRGLLGPERQRFQGPAEDECRHEPMDLSGIVRASASAGAYSLGELAEACERYAPFLDRPLGEVPEHHREHVCDRHDLELLYVRVDEKTRRPAVRPWDLPVVADALAIGVAEALQRTARFAWLGRPVPDLALAVRWAEVPVDLAVLLRRYVVEDPGGSPMLPWAATIDLAAQWEISLRKAEKILAREAAGLGLVHQRRYASGSAGRGFVPESGTGEVAGWLHGVGLRLEAGISLRDLAFAHRYDMPREELADAVDELRGAGVDIPDAAELLRAWEDLPVPSRYAFSGRDPSFDAADYPVLPSSEVLFTGSQQLNEKLSYLWKTARKEARNLGLGPELLAVDLAEDLKDYRPTWHEVHALIDWGDDEDYDEWFESPRWGVLTAAGLIGYARAEQIGARAAFEALAPLRAIGALVPELTAEAVAALPEEVPGAHDAAALDPAYRVSEPGEPLGPLDLVGIAGRLGEPVLRTWQRITPYLSLEAVPPLLNGIPETVPGWQDLVVLSEGLDGMLPAVAGTVTPERLAFAAAGVGESPGWVRGRLEHYAELFGLELSPITEDGLTEDGVTEDRVTEDSVTEDSVTEDEEQQQ
ncbi:caspase family protein [Kitasatospora sp. NPDC008050]|uniref:HD domain-containing protein n=1 Tax=Kitasatospora sp. NPDC008050 TaxID=3364021 RepID=UPI0036E42173